jgi:hypothetical protein
MPLCFSADIWTSLNENKGIPAIHQLMVTFGCKLGLLIIPFFVSTSTVRFFTPKMKMHTMGNRPYSSNFIWEWQLSTSVSAIDPNQLR